MTIDQEFFEGSMLTVSYWPISVRHPRQKTIQKSRLIKEKSLVQCSSQKHWHQVLAFGSTVLYIEHWKQLK